MGLKGFFDKVGDAARDAAESVAKGTQEAGKFVGEKAVEAANVVENATKEATNFVTQTANSVGEDAEKAFETTRDVVEQSVTSGKEFVSSTTKNLVDGPTRFFEEAKETVSGVFSKKEDESDEANGASNGKKELDFFEKALIVGMSAHMRHEYNDPAQDMLDAIFGQEDPGILEKGLKFVYEVDAVAHDWEEISKHH